MRSLGKRVGCKSSREFESPPLRKMASTEKNRKDLLNSFDLLSIYLSGFEHGEQVLYLPMSVELRKLLCERNPSPLLTRVVPNFKLYKLHITSIIEKSPTLSDGLLHFVPGKLIVNDKKVPLLTLSISNEAMVLNDWINQIFFNSGITIFDFIKSVSDKEAAHADLKDNNIIEYSKNWTYHDTSSRILGIYAIARFVRDVFEFEYRNKL